MIGEDCMKILAEMPDAVHEVMGSMTVHMGTHPKMGELVIVGDCFKFCVTAYH